MFDLALTVALGAAVIWLTVRGIPAETGRERITAYIVGFIALVLIAVQGYRNQVVVQEIRSGIATLTGRATADLRFYCGQADITGSNHEIEALWIPSDSVAPPAVWVVNVGAGDAVNVTGRLDVKESLTQLPMTGDKEYPHSVSWSIPVLHRNDPQIIWGPSSVTRERLTKVSVRMEARYNGPTAVSAFVVRLKPIPGPNYPPDYLPCPRPKLS